MPEMLTLFQVADRLAISYATARRLAVAGDLPAVRLGRQWRVPASALDDLVSSASVSAADTLDDAARLVADDLPELTDQQRERLRTLIGPALADARPS